MGSYGILKRSNWPLLNVLWILTHMSSTLEDIRDQKGFSMIGPVGSLKVPSTPEEEDLEEAPEDMGDEDMEEEDMEEDDIEENSEEDGELRSKRSSASLDGKRSYGFGLRKRSSSGLQPVLEGTDRS